VQQPIGLRLIGTKRSAPPPPHDKNEDREFQAILVERIAKRPRVHDYGRYASLPNDPNIKSALGQCRGNQDCFLIWLTWAMARNKFALPASGCLVQRMFSDSGCITAWKRSRLRDSTYYLRSHNV
jgi:hypothetical protein